MNGWLRIPKNAAGYADVGARTFEEWLRDGLKFVKVRGCRLTRPDWIDDFLMQHTIDYDRVDKIIDDVIDSLKTSGKTAKGGRHAQK